MNFENYYGTRFDMWYNSHIGVPKTKREKENKALAEKTWHAAVLEIHKDYNKQYGVQEWQIKGLPCNSWGYK